MGRGSGVLSALCAARVGVVPSAAWVWSTSTRVGVVPSACVGVVHLYTCVSGRVGQLVGHSSGTRPT